ncbi:hypothetical protein DSO57_1030612 [Entomophthora muscae]|uniref:Uncharacterized protein n=1 Tax=Entomophthora muscae TaxID=34485 RepID=A0ACC2UB08_9FUNG|nr:hypothetical protein DSO57_1030612 [Entomophthora muscae]
MTPPLTPQPDRPMETPTAADTMSTQMFGVLYITFTGMIDTMVPNSGPWSLLGQYISYIIKLAPILWWALPSGPAVFIPKPTNASAYAWFPDNQDLVLLLSPGATADSVFRATVWTWLLVLGTIGFEGQNLVYSKAYCESDNYEGKAPDEGNIEDKFVGQMLTWTTHKVVQ